MIAFLWAESQNGVIGNHGDLPWHMPADLHYFKQTTMNHVILVGRTTFQTFGRPLPNRINAVLTHQPAEQFPVGVKVFHSVDEFMAFYHKNDDQDVFVVGGAKIYAELLPFVDRLYQTVIKANIDGDTKMPVIDYHQFQLLQQTDHQADAKNPYDYAFKIYQRL